MPVNSTAKVAAGQDLEHSIAIHFGTEVPAENLDFGGACRMISESTRSLEPIVLTSNLTTVEKREPKSTSLNPRKCDHPNPPAQSPGDSSCHLDADPDINGSRRSFADQSSLFIVGEYENVGAVNRPQNLCRALRACNDLSIEDHRMT
jgi:hypothetical protein